MRFLIIFILTTQLTHGQIGKIKLLDFKSSTCDEPTLSSRLRPRIIKNETKDDVLTIEIATVATCCVKFEPIVSTGQGIFYLDFKECAGNFTQQRGTIKQILTHTFYSQHASQQRI